MRRGALVFFLCLSFGAAQAPAETAWRVDQGPSSVTFRVQHLLFSQVDGRFEKFDGTIVTGDSRSEDFSGARITASIQAKSVYTGHRDRDNGLRGKDFFWISEYPEIRFESDAVTRTGERTYRIDGQLTIRGVSRNIELQAVYGGRRVTSLGTTRADFHVSGSLNRFDYGLRWNELLETGRALVGATVELALDMAIVLDESTPADSSE